MTHMHTDTQCSVAVPGDGYFVRFVAGDGDATVLR